MDVLPPNMLFALRSDKAGRCLDGGNAPARDTECRLPTPTHQRPSPGALVAPEYIRLGSSWCARKAILRHDERRAIGSCPNRNSRAKAAIPLRTSIGAPSDRLIARAASRGGADQKHPRWSHEPAPSRTTWLPVAWVRGGAAHKGRGAGHSIEAA
jgi:hypothetical protein